MYNYSTVTVEYIPTQIKYIRSFGISCYLETIVLYL